MIRNIAVRGEIEEDWKAVKELTKHRALQYQLPGHAFVNTPGPPDGYYNLPFFLAYAVLDRVLEELIDQGAFSCSGWRPQLGAKMEISKSTLPWKNFDPVAEGREARNNLAHRASLVSKEDCFKYISAIGAELVAWGVLTA